MGNTVLTVTLPACNCGSGQKKYQSTNLRNLLIATMLLLWLPWGVRAQAPTISYSSPQIYMAGTAISQLTPTASGVAAQAFKRTPLTIGSGFNSPYGVAVDAAGNIYMVEGSNRVVKIPAGGGTPLTIGSGFNSPLGVAVDAAGNIYVADFQNNAVKKIPAGGGSPLTIGSGFNQPTDVAVDAAGNVYVADNGNNAVKKIPAGGGTPLTIGSGFNFPDHVAVDAAGNVYVVESFNNAIKKIPAGGGTPVSIGSGLDQPRGVAVDVAGDVYVTEPNHNMVIKIRAGDGTWRAIGSGFDYPQGVAVDAAGNVYVADTHHNAVKIIPAGGGTPLTIGSDFTNPEGVAVDAAGNVYVADSDNDAVKKIPAGGGRPVTIGSGFNRPKGVAVDAAGNVYVADFQNNAVKKIPAGGGTPLTIGSGFSYPWSVAVNAAGNVYVADMRHNAVKIIPAGGGTPLTIGSGFNRPQGVAVDAAGNVYVADDGVVIKIPAGGGTPVTIGSGFSAPQGVAVDAAGNVYMTDAGNNAVKEIPAGGGTPITIGSGFNSPQGVAVDAVGNIYVANYGNTIKKIIPAGGYYTSPFLPTGLTINTNTGVISGTPTVVSPATNYIVTAYNATGSSTATVNIKIVASPTDATLSNLTASSGVFDQAFAPATTAYTQMVPFITSSITVTPTASAMDPEAAITVNGVSLTSAAASGAIPLNIGPNTITINVTAIDGLTTKTYTIIVTRVQVPPTISYRNPQTYTRGLAITPLVPTANWVGAQAYNSTLVTIGSGYYFPEGIAADAAGNVYVVEPLNNTVKKIPARGGTPVTIGSGFNYPTAVAVDAAGNVYVADRRNNGIKKIPAGGGTPLTIGSGFNYPTGVAVDAAGNVYVADYGNNAVKKIPAGGGTPLTIGSGFNFPYGVAVDAAGNVYVAEPLNNTVKKIPAGGGTPLTIGSGFKYPTAVAVDAAGNVYVADFYNNAIKKIPAGGGTPHFIGPDFLSSSAVAVDGAGNVYVLDHTNGLIEKIKPTGGYYIRTFLPPGLSFDDHTGIISGTPTVASPATNYTVTAYNIVGSNTATVNIKIVGDNANMANLNLSSGTLTPVFATATKSYTASVGNAITALTLTPTAEDPMATISVNGAAVVSGAASASVPLAVGPNTITTVVTAQDGVTTITYTVIVTRAPSSNAGLAGLAVSAGILSPVFATGTNNYTDPVPVATTSLTVTPTLADNTAAITVNGTAVASGSASAGIPLAIGPNTITAVVTAQDGVTINTYTLTVNRVAPTKNAGLVSIRTNPSQSALVGVSGPGYLNYTAVVYNTTTAIRVIPTAADPNATITVNGAAVLSGYPSAGIPLAVGPNTITTVITAALGGSTKTIILTVTRKEPSTNAEIASITTNPRESTLVGVAGPGYLNYTEAVTNSTNSIQVIATAKEPTATITVNGIAAVSGSPSSPIALNIGANVITTIVTAPDGVSTRTVIITVNRAGPSNNAQIASITTNPKESTLVGVAGPGYLNYTEAVTNSTNSIRVIATAKEPTATITVNGTAAISGSPSSPIALNIGANVITTIVTAPDGVSTKTVIITVNRAAAPVLNSSYQQIAVDPSRQSAPIETDGIAVHQGLSPNGDGINDVLVIDGIASCPENKLTIVNRNGALVYEAQRYDNLSKVFDGHASTNGAMQLPGTYFYALDYSVNGVAKHKTGYFVLKY